MGLSEPSSSERAVRDGTGRVHLALYTDGASGRELFGLQTKLFEEQWQDDVVAGTVNTSVGVLGSHVELTRLLELTRVVLNATSRLIRGVLAGPGGGAVACKAGCDHCCHVAVSVTVPEALTIFDYLTRSFSAEARARLGARIADFRGRTRGLSSAERFSPEYPCVFLEAGCCSIYEVRPLACRGMNSLDAAECEARLRDPALRRAFAENGGGKLFREPVHAFHAVSAGLQLALSELYGLDARPLELSGAMQLLFEGGLPVIEAWLSGARAFDAASSDGRATVSI
jgi:Fe-S-cluster containining protein